MVYSLNQSLVIDSLQEFSMARAYTVHPHCFWDQSHAQQSLNIEGSSLHMALSAVVLTTASISP